MDIAVIGAGNMGQALTRRFVIGGHTVYLASRNDDNVRKLASEIASAGPGSVVATSILDAAARCPVTVFALWFNDATRVAVQLSDVLAGKIVVEISNPFNATYDDLVTDPTTSAGEEIQRRIPQGQVVKAFNTVFAPVCTEGGLNGTQADVFLASDYEDARRTVADLVRSCKMRPINAGALKNARILERWALLNVEITMRYNLNFRSGVKVIPLLLPTDRGGESTAEAKTK